MDVTQWVRSDMHHEVNDNVPSFSALIKYLRKAQYDVVEAAFLPHTQLRVGVCNAVAATINGDRFAIYKCQNAESAHLAGEGDNIAGLLRRHGECLV